MLLTDLLSMAFTACFLISQGHQPKGSFHSEPDLPHEPSVKKISYRLAYGTVLEKDFLDQYSFLPEYPSLCQVDTTLASTDNGHLLTQ